MGATQNVGYLTQAKGFPPRPVSQRYRRPHGVTCLTYLALTRLQ